jgi:glucose/mannose-6-phosphate isomerase
MPMDLATLDDPDVIGGVDRGGMLGVVAGTGAQLRRGFELGRSSPFLPSAEGIDAIVVGGMGGSGVAGDVLRSVCAAEVGVPIVVVKGYSLPAFCGPDTLVFAVSFSGGTEETLAVYAEGVARGCRTVAVSTGGELAALAEADDVAHVSVPDDVPMPRAALGYLAAIPLGVLDALGLLPPLSKSVDRTAALLDDLAVRLGPAARGEVNEAKSVASWLGQRVPLVWGTEGPTEAAALRWKTQFEENAKIAAFHAMLPELDHNDVEGLAGGDGARFAAIALRHDGEHPRMAARIEATRAALSGSGLGVREVRAAESSPLDVAFSLMMLGDFVSVYTAILRGVDPMPVPVLTGLKERLRGMRPS